MFPKPVLIIGCGDKKQRGTVPIRDLYSKGNWEAYRKYAPEGKHPNIDVYVISAEYGLLPEDRMACDYNRVLVSSSKRSLQPHEKRAKDLVPLLKKQIQQDRLQGREVNVVASKAYQEALDLAGLDFQYLPTHPEYPDREGRGGSGKQKSSLIWFLKEFS